MKYTKSIDKWLFELEAIGWQVGVYRPRLDFEMIIYFMES